MSLYSRKKREAFYGIGHSGGSTIININYQNILNVIDHGMSMQEAVHAKKLHSQWLPDRIIVEAGSIDSLIINQLKALGHNIRVSEQLG